MSLIPPPIPLCLRSKTSPGEVAIPSRWHAERPCFLRPNQLSVGLLEL
jgi:hypothetical protein